MQKTLFQKTLFAFALLFLAFSQSASAQTPPADITLAYNAGGNYSVKAQVASVPVNGAATGQICIRRTDVTPALEMGCIPASISTTALAVGSTQTVAFIHNITPGTVAHFRAYAKPVSTAVGTGDSGLSANEALVTAPLNAPGNPVVIP